MSKLLRKMVADHATSILQRLGHVLYLPEYKRAHEWVEEIKAGGSPEYELDEHVAAIGGAPIKILVAEYHTEGQAVYQRRCTLATLELAHAVLHDRKSSDISDEDAVAMLLRAIELFVCEDRGASAGLILSMGDE